MGIDNFDPRLSGYLMRVDLLRSGIITSIA